MKKIILIGLFLILIISNVTGDDAFSSELGGLSYVYNNSHIIDYFGLYWGSAVEDMIIFSVPYAGNYSFHFESADSLKFYQADESGELVYIGDKAGDFYAYFDKPFFAVKVVDGKWLYKNSTITLIKSNYNHINYSENYNNTHGALCPLGADCDIISWIISTKGINQVQWDINTSQTTYYQLYHLNLINHCNLVDIPENVTLFQTGRDITNWSNTISTTHTILLQPYTFNITPSPSIDYTSSIDYTNTFYFSLDGISHDETEYGLNESTSWYWDDIPITPQYTSTYYTLDVLSLANFSQYNTNPGNHTLSAYVYLTCDSYELITWNLSLSTAEPILSSLSGTIYTEDNDPLYNISLTLVDIISPINYFSFDTTDTDGNYSFDNIPTGAYYWLLISGNDNYNDQSYFFYNSGNQTKNFWLSKNFTQNLTLRIYAWNRLTDSQIYNGICYLMQGTVNYTATMDSDGYCVWLSNLSAGTYDLKVSQGDYCPYIGTYELSTNHVKVVYLKSKEVEVSGFITNTDYEVISGADVEFWLNNSILISTAVTDTNGYYLSDNLTEGNYTITISAAGHDIKSEIHNLSGQSCYYPNPYWRDFVLDRTIQYTSLAFLIQDIDSTTPITDYSFWLYDSNGIILIHIDNNETITSRDINFTYGLVDYYNDGYESSYITMYLPRYNYYSWKVGATGYINYFSGDIYDEETFYTEDLSNPEGFNLINIYFKSSAILNASAYTIIGHVKNDKGVSVSSAEVTMSKSNLGGHRTTLSNITGDFEFTNITEGEYWFLIDHPAHEGFSSDDYYIANNATFEFIIKEISTYIPPVVTPTCNDNIQNGEETGIDCGGPCDPCMCFNNWDCASDGSEQCIDNECILDTCITDSDCLPLLWYNIQNGYYTRARECNNGICHFISANETIASIYMTITPISKQEWNDTGRTVYLSSCEENNNGFIIITNNKTKKWYYHADPTHYTPYVNPTDNLVFGLDSYEKEVIALIPDLCEMPLTDNLTYSLIVFQVTDGSRWFQQSIYTLTFRYAFSSNAEYHAENQILINITRGAICFYKQKDTDIWTQINTVEEAKILFNMSTSDKYLFFCNNSFGEETTTEYGGGMRSILIFFYNIFVLFISEFYIVLFGSSFIWQPWYILPVMVLLLFVFPTLLLTVLYMHNRTKQNENQD